MAQPLRVNTTRATFNAPANDAVLSVTIPAPTAGNTLIIIFGSYAPGQYFPEGHGGQTEYNGYISVVSISQGSASWTKQASATQNSNLDLEQWAAPNVPSGLTTTIQITINSPGANANNNVVVEVLEYSSLVISSILDRTASSNGTGTASNTGTTLATTQPSELALGCTVSSAGSQSTPTNGYTLIDGAEVGGSLSVAGLEKILSATGTQNSGTTISSSSAFLGLIATYFGGSASQLYTATTTDSLSVSDSPVEVTVRVVAKTDSLTASDSLASQRIAPIALTSSVAVSDSVVSKASLVRTISEPDLNVDGSQLSVISIRNPTITDSESITDTLVKSYVSIRTKTDSVTISDNGIAILRNPHMTDSVAVADSISTGNAVLHLISLLESLPVADSLVENYVYGRLITEPTLGIFDLLGISSAPTDLSDALPIGDVIIAQSLLGRKINETNLNISDDLTRFNLRTPNITDNISVSDSLVRKLLASRGLLENLPITDILGLIRSAYITDAMLTSDGIVITLATGQLLRVVLLVDQRTVGLFAEAVGTDEMEH